MSLFLDVVTDMTLPVVLMIGFGFARKRWAGLEVTALSPLAITVLVTISRVWRMLVAPAIIAIAGSHRIT